MTIQVSATLTVGIALDGGGTGFNVVRNKLVPSSLNEYLELYFASKVDEYATVVVFSYFTFPFPNKILASHPEL